MSRVIDMLDEIVEKIRIMEVKVACSGYDASVGMQSITDSLLGVTRYIDSNYPNIGDTIKRQGNLETELGRGVTPCLLDREAGTV
jgi:hypothetical protein